MCSRQSFVCSLMYSLQVHDCLDDILAGLGKLKHLILSKVAQGIIPGRVLIGNVVIADHLLKGVLPFDNCILDAEGRH
jgi:hypothetical protein